MEKGDSGLRVGDIKKMFYLLNSERFNTLPARIFMPRADYEAMEAWYIEDTVIREAAKSVLNEIYGRR